MFKTHPKRKLWTQKSSLISFPEHKLQTLPKLSKNRKRRNAYKFIVYGQNKLDNKPEKDIIGK